MVAVIATRIRGGGREGSSIAEPVRPRLNTKLSNECTVSRVASAVVSRTSIGSLTCACTNSSNSTLFLEYESVLRNHLIPAFGPVQFTKINREMVKQLVAEKVKAGL